MTLPRKSGSRLETVEERQDQYMSLPRKLYRLEQIQMHGKDYQMNQIHIHL